MRILTLLLFLVTAAGCFFAGYQWAQLNPPAAAADKATTQPSSDLPAANPTTSDSASAVPHPGQLESTAAQPLLATPAQQAHSLAQRALQPVHTFTDQRGRQLEAEIIAIQADALEIRRLSDRRILQLPVKLLCEVDQAFAAYLWKQQQAAAAATMPPSTSAEDQIWEQLFN